MPPSPVGCSPLYLQIGKGPEAASKLRLGCWRYILYWSTGVINWAKSGQIWFNDHENHESFWRILAFVEENPTQEILGQNCNLPGL